MNVLFLHTPKFNNYYRPIGEFSFVHYPPMGLLGLADFLRQNGHSSKIVHLGVEKRKSGQIDLKRLVADNAPTIIGLDLHWHFQSFDVIEIARSIKQAYPGIPILLGGFTASFFAEEILQNFDCIDFIIRGDAETPLLELVRQCLSDHDYHTVPNLAFRENGTVRAGQVTYVADEQMLNSLCCTDFTLMKDYPIFVESFSRYMNIESLSENCQRLLFRWKRTYPVLLARGCPYNCVYCGGGAKAHSIINNRSKVISRSVEAVLSSITDIHRFGFDSVVFPQDPFPSKDGEKFYMAIFDGMRALDIPLEVEVERYSLPSREFLRSFRQLPMKTGSFITLSPHTHDQELRKRNGLANYTNEDLERCLGMMEEEEVNCLLCFSIGLPFETSNHMDEMVQYQKQLKRRFRRLRFKNCMVEIEPASPLSIKPAAFGVEPHRLTFADYYRYHSLPRQNHFQELGYDRKDAPNQRELARFSCRHFCTRFDLGAASPGVCRIISGLRQVGAFTLLDKAASKVKADHSVA